MTTLETILRELADSPEPVLATVLDFIQSAKNNCDREIQQSLQPRIPGLHQGQIWMSEDFNDPLPDEFWLGEEK